MAVTANQVIARQDGCRGHIPAEEATTHYQATLVFVNAAGYAVPTTGSGANRFGGVAVENVDNSAGADGDKNVEVYKKGVFELPGSGFTQADVGKDAYASDNFTVSANPLLASGVRIGQIDRYISSTKVAVRIDPSRENKLVATVAAAGSSQGTAAPLTADVNNVTGANGTLAVVLPAIEIGKSIEVYNAVATNGLPIYPHTDGTINGGSANAAITIEGKTTARLTRIDATNWSAQFTANT